MNVSVMWLTTAEEGTSVDTVADAESRAEVIKVTAKEAAASAICRVVFSNIVI